MWPILREKDTVDSDRTFSETGGLGGKYPSPKIHNMFGARTTDWKLIYNLRLMNMSFIIYLKTLRSYTIWRVKVNGLKRLKNHYKNILEYKTMKAIILAAGLGSRLMPLTKEIPKSMLKVGGKPILKWIVET